MKNLLLFPSFVLFLLSTHHQLSAQITLQHTLDSTYIGNNFYCTDIGNNDHKLVYLDPVNNSFSLYNMDMSPYLVNIQIPSTGDSISNGFTVIYITKSLFDCDSTNIEYVFEDPYNGINHPFRVYRTDGTLLLQVDNANGPYCIGCYGGSQTIKPIINTSDGTKLFVQKQDTNLVGQILVYSLCGILPNAIYDFGNDQISFVRIFPNPSTDELKFEITPPNNQEKFEIVILDSDAKEKRRFAAESIHDLDVSNLSNGIYYYSFASKSKVYQSGKFIITR